ncbi:MAG TPA: hypothetical protein EYQ64_06020 [Gemmatimonadetes bacterium]|nr:hypothetical protein [Gemmatimonadota bacterium]
MWEEVVETAPVVDGTRKITARHVAEVVARPKPAPAVVPLPWGDEDEWCWKLKNLYTQSPKRSQKAFTPF